MVDLTNKVPIPGEDVCSQCSEYKKIIAIQGSELLCEDCFNEDAIDDEYENV